MIKKTEITNTESIYDELISPLMAQIIRLCKDHNIPLVATFQLAPFVTDKDTLMCTTILDYALPEQEPLIKKLCAVLYHHFDVVPPSFAMAITTDKIATL